ncbi:hypothetical protein AWH56_018605 [Anaerobacillus isosaccharinicus]|uniref:Uncharacterized protein n=1 Tax=Anaerobacillus isosaccharinicus TaxID=1532552 RepID=A0A1S2LGT0_9BACI|nr:hypothetical protein [Anaerobacillus isosaccharinicus]MBA5587084.1 hypothetical protein [Anaerobacillus isosaccharinicus]QOY34720.1 hypothetical protein AWH56_018605 [Anaerobacillus isosaccharinicus]
MKRINKILFSVNYTQDGNKVVIKGDNPLSPNDKYTGEIVFQNSIQAEGFCLTIRTLEAAIEDDYRDEYSIVIEDDVVEINTITELSPNKKRKIEERVKKNSFCYANR